MAKACKYQLRNGRVGTEIVLEPPLESEPETESDEEQMAEDETVSSESESDSENDQTRKKTGAKRRFKWGKSNVLPSHVPFLSKFHSIDDEVRSPICYFRQVFDENISKTIAEQTNSYSVQKQEKNINTTSNEIDRFLGILLKMTIVPLPRYRMFWESATVIIINKCNILSEIFLAIRQEKVADCH